MRITTASSIQALDPTIEPDPIESRLAARPPSLDGKRLGLLANSKRNSDLLLEEIAAVLGERHTFAAVRRWAKPNVTRPAPEPIFAEMLGQVDLVVTAIGD